MFIAFTVIMIAISLVLAYLALAYHADLLWAEDEIRALKETIDAMHDNRPSRPSTPSQSETLILRK